MEKFVCEIQFKKINYSWSSCDAKHSLKKDLIVRKFVSKLKFKKNYKSCFNLYPKRSFKKYIRRCKVYKKVIHRSRQTNLSELHVQQQQQ